MIIVTAEEMRALDAWTIHAGTPGRVLMARAAAGALRVLTDMETHSRGPVIVVCGKGNNGGDGFVLARLLRARRRAVETWLVGDPATVRGDAQDALARWRRVGGVVQGVRSPEDLARLAPRLQKARVIVDAIFGTGLAAPVEGLVAGLVEAINRADAPVLAMDISSGLCADRGQPLGVAVRADATATMAFRKVGQCQYPGIALSGRVTIIDIGIPPEAVEAIRPRTFLLSPAALAPSVPTRAPDAHKGTNGHVLVIAGSAGKVGAGLLAASGAARAGAGLTTLAVPASLLARVDGRIPEIMTTPLPDTGDGAAAALHPATIASWLAPYAAIVLGPGLGVGTEARALVAQVLAAARAPVVLDADGLNAVAGTDALRRRDHPTIVTPHPGEMSRLISVATREVQADRVRHARRLAKREGVVVVLKGAGTVVATPDGRASISLAGNPGMATAGMGDVLAGIVGGLLAQGLDPETAATLAVYAHGVAGDRVAARIGPIGLLAGDVAMELPSALASLHEVGA